MVALLIKITITVNERTKAGRSLVGYLRSLGVIDEPNEETLAAANEIRNGGGTRCNSFEDYLKAVQTL
ncbi:MAG: hypothetical protein IJS66_03270 [Bacteroidales bacterium]|nr:hypothetical protein [Bacteroidales bacterium]